LQGTESDHDAAHQYEDEVRKLCAFLCHREYCGRLLRMMAVSSMTTILMSLMRVQLLRFLWRAQRCATGANGKRTGGRHASYAPISG
jgi:hypothetical protein